MRVPDREDAHADHRHGQMASTSTLKSSMREALSWTVTQPMVLADIARRDKIDLDEYPSCIR